MKQTADHCFVSVHREYRCEEKVYFCIMYGITVFMSNNYYYGHMTYAKL